MTRPRRSPRAERPDPLSFEPLAFPSPGKQDAGDERARARRDRWNALLADHPAILADGAMGTMLFSAGLQFGDPPEVWNLSHPDLVRRIHRGYLEAGSQILMTNTFGGNRLRLGLHNLESRVVELNQTGP